MTAEGYAFLGLTAIVAILVAALTYAVLRFGLAARDARVRSRESGESALLAAALQDAVTRLKAQERAMAARAEASERLSGEIIASLTAGLVVIGLDGGVRILNPAARRLLGVPDAAPLGAFGKLIDDPTLSNLVQECLTSRTAILRRTIQLPAQEGRATHLGVTVSPLAGDQGELHGAVCLFSDLTKVMRLEEQLRLKESLATVGELTAGIAHEFRNGLATIMGYSRLLKTDALSDADRTFVEGIRGEAESLGQIVTNFLSFARPAHLTLSRVELGQVCERAAEDLRAEVRTLGGDIVMRGEFGAVDGDEVLLRQAVSNLLRNAVEACKIAGIVPTVVVSSGVDPGERISRITVDDNGPGIAAEDRERVFRPFYTSKRDGTGLGLALVQKIIVFHNGRIHADASALGGASLQMTLPLAS